MQHHSLTRRFRSVVAASEARLLYQNQQPQEMPETALKDLNQTEGWEKSERAYDKVQMRVDEYVQKLEQLYKTLGDTSPQFQDIKTGQIQYIKSVMTNPFYSKNYPVIDPNGQMHDQLFFEVDHCEELYKRVDGIIARLEQEVKNRKGEASVPCTLKQEQLEDRHSRLHVQMDQAEDGKKLRSIEIAGYTDPFANRDNNKREAYHLLRVPSDVIVEFQDIRLQRGDYRVVPLSGGAQYYKFFDSAIRKFEEAHARNPDGFAAVLRDAKGNEIGTATVKMSGDGLRNIIFTFEKKKDEPLKPTIEKDEPTKPSVVREPKIKRKKMKKIPEEKPTEPEQQKMIPLIDEEKMEPGLDLPGSKKKDISIPKMNPDRIDNAPKPKPSDTQPQLQTTTGKDRNPVDMENKIQKPAEKQSERVPPFKDKSVELTGVKPPLEKKDFEIAKLKKVESELPLYEVTNWKQELVVGEKHTVVINPPLGANSVPFAIPYGHGKEILPGQDGFAKYPPDGDAQFSVQRSEKDLIISPTKPGRYTLAISGKEFTFTAVEKPFEKFGEEIYTIDSKSVPTKEMQSKSSQQKFSEDTKKTDNKKEALELENAQLQIESYSSGLPAGMTSPEFPIKGPIQKVVDNLNDQLRKQCEGVTAVPEKDGFRLVVSESAKPGQNISLKVGADTLELTTEEKIEFSKERLQNLLRVLKIHQDYFLDQLVHHREDEGGMARNRMGSDTCKFLMDSIASLPTDPKSNRRGEQMQKLQSNLSLYRSAYSNEIALPANQTKDNIDALFDSEGRPKYDRAVTKGTRESPQLSEDIMQEQQPSAKQNASKDNSTAVPPRAPEQNKDLPNQQTKTSRLLTDAPSIIFPKRDNDTSQDLPLTAKIESNSITGFDYSKTAYQPTPELIGMDPKYLREQEKYLSEQKKLEATRSQCRATLQVLAQNIRLTKHNASPQSEYSQAYGFVQEFDDLDRSLMRLIDRKDSSDNPSTLSLEMMKSRRIEMQKVLEKFDTLATALPVAYAHWKKDEEKKKEKQEFTYQDSPNEGSYGMPLIGLKNRKG